ncbi:MAG: ExbD/TolR family protein [Myxococcota bacterium]
MIKFSQQKPAGIGDVNLTPMIDIIFNLLIFFLIVAVISQKGLNLALPETSTAEKRPPKSLEITVTKDRRILFDGTAVAEDSLDSRLRAEKQKAEAERAQNIVLKADKDAPFGTFVLVMDTARKVGLKNLVIATKLETKKPGD